MEKVGIKEHIEGDLLAWEFKRFWVGIIEDMEKSVEFQPADYSLIGKDTLWQSKKAWPRRPGTPRPCRRQRCASCSKRRDGPAIRDTLLWFAPAVRLCGLRVFLLWGTWWAILPFALYGVLYASTSDSRWHESGHGTAFKTDWMNNALYEIASFMVLRESTRWRWSHTRHHSDTIIVGRDPEIAVPRPAKPAVAHL